MHPGRYYGAIFFVVVLLLSLDNCQAQRIGTPFGLAEENPGISVVGSFMSRYDEEQAEPVFGLSDAEIGFQAPVDTYARFDVLLHYASDRFTSGHDHDEDGHEHGSGFAVEEALITLTSLPWRFQFSGGRMRSKIGLLNVVHLHDFNFINYPEPITRYFGAEGLMNDGVRISWLSPLPIWAEFILEGQKINSDEEDDYGTGGVNVFLPFGENAGLMLTGFGYYNNQSHNNPLAPELHHNDEDNHVDEHDLEYDAFIDNLSGNKDNEINGSGIGIRYKWQPITRALYKHVIIQSEFMNRAFGDESYSGAYIYGEYKFSQRWSAGIMLQSTKYPHVHEHDDSFEIEEENIEGASLALSHYLTHFQRLRLQFDYRNEMDITDKRVTLQWTFLIGPHKPHSY